jgi:N utilization substance protein B
MEVNMSRRTAREAALQTLYQIDLGLVSPGEAFNYALEATPLDDKDRQFALAIIEQAVKDWSISDDLIAAAAVDWKLERLARVDRSLLKMAIAELMRRADDTPPGVIINEAIEISKRYSSEESSKFINGILGQLVRQQGWV